MTHYLCSGIIKANRFFFTLFLMLVCATNSLLAQKYSTSDLVPCDSLASIETIRLYNFLKSVEGKGLLFGQHHASVEGQGWRGQGVSEGISTDVFKVTGDQPAIFGFDFNRGISVFREQVLAIFKMGGIITYSWHSNNPVTGGNPHDKKGNPVEAILPGGKLHGEWLKKLDEIADFFLSLKVNDVMVPVIFRPFHENTGGWFWWGKNNCTPAQFRMLWKMTIDYLRKERGVHNLLIAYSPSRPSEMSDLALSMYPGDDYVDIIGSDLYAPDNPKWPGLLVKESEWITGMAKAHGKVGALTEVGVKEGLNNSRESGWFTGRFINLLKNNPSINLSYMLTWRNRDSTQYWVPVKGQVNYEDFIEFYKDPFTLFLSDIRNIYPKADY